MRLRDRLRANLPSAIRARDPISMAAIRSALAAIDNAEAADPSDVSLLADGHPWVAGSVAGLGSAEVPRRRLDEAAVRAIVLAEAVSRRAAATEYERGGRGAEAARLRAEAHVLAGFVDPGPETS